MDFDDAILAHTRWKRRLQQSMGGGERLDPAMVRRDDLCDLGKWLQGDGAAFATEPEYTTLVQAHASFHRAAAAVVERISRGETDEGGKLIGMHSDYAEHSGAVVKAITAIRDHIAAS